MKFDKSITDKHTDKILHAGRVIKRKTIFTDNAQAVKRLIVLTNNNETTVLAITTTKNIKPRKYYNKDDILITANQEKPFELDTYIQMQRVIEIPNEKLKEEFNVLQMENLGVISNRLLEEIYDRIENSEFIEQRQIIRIMEEKGKKIFKQ